MIPGLKVITPTFPADAKGMIISAIEDNNPVVVIEHRCATILKVMFQINIINRKLKNQ